MSDEIENLPDRLEYLRPVLRAYTLPRHDRTFEDPRALADELGDDGLRELADAYREIVRRDDVHALSAWAKADENRYDAQRKRWLAVNDAREARGEACLPEDVSPIRPRGRQLFYVFDRLAERRLPPFAMREVQYSPPPVVLDWTKLPEDLRYVAAPAKAYSEFWGPANRKRLARRLAVAPQEKAQLVALAARMRPTDYGRLDEWLRAYPLEDHPEAELVFTLLAVLGDVVPW